jgi:hypothetical protein
MPFWLFLLLFVIGDIITARLYFRFYPWDMQRRYAEFTAKERKDIPGHIKPTDIQYGYNSYDYTDRTVILHEEYALPRLLRILASMAAGLTWPITLPIGVIYTAVTVGANDRYQAEAKKAQKAQAKAIKKAQTDKRIKELEAASDEWKAKLANWDEEAEINLD